jgi:HlyD family secretion protein
VRETSLYFEQPGRVQTLNVEPNDRVGEGDVLARLEIDGLLHELRLSEIDLRIAEANLEKMQGTSAAPIDRRIQELVVEKHRAVVERRRWQIETATIRAPHDGIVRRVLVKVSDQVTDYEPVIDIADPDVVELQMTISEEAYRTVENRMEAEVEVETDRWEPVRIIQTSHQNPQFDSSVRRELFLVHFQMPENRQGMETFSQYPVRIYRARREDTLVIPSAALRESRGRAYVRVIEDEVRREVDVRVGIRGATRVEILEGLSAGDVVIGR